MKNNVLATALLVLSTTSAMAEFKGAEFNLGYSRIDESGITIDNTDFGASADFGLGENFTLGAGASFASLDIADANLTVFHLSGDYAFSSGMSAGIFVDHSRVTFTGGDLEATHAGVSMSFQSRNVTGGGFVGIGDSNDLGLESTVYGANLNFGLSNNFDLGTFFTAEDIDGVGKVSEYGVTIGYEFADAAVPVYLTAGYSKLDDTFDTVDVVRVGLTVPLGGAAEKGRKPVNGHSTAINSVAVLGDVSF